MSYAAPSRAARLAVVAALAAAASAAGAQQVYRIVGPDGRVTFSDQPPPSGTKAQSSPVASAAGGGASGSLPFELRQAASRYPVTLYTGPNCGPCASGRDFLSSRGIPFIEKTVGTPADAQALERLAGSPSLPLLTIGSQQLKGFSDAEWAQFLDAAGYPKTSQLPPGYRQVPASPLVAVAQPAAPAPAPAAAARAPAAAPAPAAPAGSNPAGITF